MTKSNGDLPTVEQRTEQLRAATAEYKAATAAMQRAHAERAAFFDGLPKAEFMRRDSPDGCYNAVEPSTGIMVSILPDDEPRVLTHERTRRPLAGSGTLTSFLKCQLADVWVYVVGTHIVITKRELHIEDLL